ncbi:MAG: hypothetical protein U9P12_04845 [Verrucomicrobiota bacterium]|nr:hypothetical protein [Verrucomicrobiota bacterium]
MKIRTTALFAGMMLAAASTMAVTINFTDAEGYSGDGTFVWGSNSRLDIQTPTVGSWDETSANTFSVDSTAGIVNVDGTKSFKKAIYQEGLTNTNTIYQVGVKFSFNRATNQILSRAGVIAVELTEVASGGNRLSLEFERQLGANSGKYRLNFWENTGSSNTGGNDGWSDETSWGFADAADVESDPLWLQMTLHRGADASSWLVSGVISNMLTGFAETMPTNTIGLFDTSAAYFTDPLYGLINQSDLDATGNFSNRVVDVFALGEPEFEIPPVLPVDIDTHFTLAEGYVAGDLVNNSVWGGHSDFTVNPTNTGMVVLPAGAVQFKKAIHQTSLTSNELYSVGVEFSFDRTNDTVLATQANLISVEFSEVSDTSGDRLAMQLRRQPSPNADSYILSMVDQIGTSSFPSSDSFGEEALGFDTNAVLSASDSLWLGFTIRRGATTNDWTATGVVSNLTDGTEVISFSEAFDTTEAFFNDGSLYALIGSVAAEDSTKTLNRVVDRFVASAGDAPVVAEQPTMVEFSAAQGYVPGDVVGQLGYWSGHAGENLVDATTNHLVLSSSATDTFRQATYSYPLLTTNDQIEVGGTFHFSLSTNGTPTQTTMMVFALKEGLATGDDNLRVVLNRAETNAPMFSLGFNENSGDFSFTNNGNFVDTELGFGVGDDLSDELKMSLIAYPGTETNNWSAYLVLSNLTAGTEVDSLSVPAGSFTVSEEWNSAVALYGNINSAWLEADTLTSNRQVENFYVDALAFGSAYEKWAVENGVGGMDEDADGDGLNNLGEYGLGGDPKDPNDTGIKYTAVNGGDFEFMHAMLTDSESGIEYIVEVNDMGNLVFGSWTNTGITITSGTLDDDFDMVTNSIPVSGDREFIRLRINEL